METHLALTQPTQVNKITTSCEICNGPYDTQYCMEDPEQAFVEYASSRTDEAGDVEEPLDLVDTSEESVYESLIKEMPICSLNYDFTIKKGDPRNLKIPCMIGYKFTTNAYIDVDLPMNIMSLAYYIRKNGYEYRGRKFIGLGRDMHVFVVNMSYVIDFTILENIETNIDPSLSHMIFGRPFIEIACLAINRKHGLMTFMNGTKEITFKTSYKDPERCELSSEGHDLLSSRVILSEDDYDRGCRKLSDLEDETDDELTEKELKQVEADEQPIQTILLVFLKTSMLLIQEKKDFSKLMNDFKRNKHFPEKIGSNLKFLNNLQPEWSRHVVQNAVQNSCVQNVGNQNGFIVVSRIANQNPNVNGNVVAARAGGNAIVNNGNQIRRYNCRGLSHLARNCTVRPRRRDAAYLQTQLLIAQKEEAGIQLQAKEFDLMAVAANLDEI
ncbi:hypothetical protein Tco_0458087 [Tanacetum coccineum]